MCDLYIKDSICIFKQVTLFLDISIQRKVFAKYVTFMTKLNVTHIGAYLTWVKTTKFCMHVHSYANHLIIFFLKLLKT